MLCRFIKHDLTEENYYEQPPKQNEIPINLTPEYTCNNLSSFEKANGNFLLISEQLKTEMNGGDPDVTQLEIDISSTSISIPYNHNSNVKKRQLILLSENSDDHSIISDIMAYSLQNEI